MTNTTDKSILTAAGKALLAQLNAEEKALVIDKMIFANVPNRPVYPQSDDVVPSNNIVHEDIVEQRGRLSVDSVIYTTTLTSDEGPFEFNWTGAYCSEYDVLVTIDHHALTPKTADEPGVAGNTLVRSVVLEYKDIAEITNITVDASSWQYNATPRMKKMDSDSVQAIIDQNGKDWFIEDGFQVTPQATAFNIKAGAGYVSGNRVRLEFDRIVQVPSKPSFIYVDAHREGTPTGEQVTLFDLVVTAEEKDDYTSEQGVNHFVCKTAQVLADGSVSDLRVYDLQEKLWVSGDKVKSSKDKRVFRKEGHITDGMIWFSPKASYSNPVTMSDNPIHDSNFEPWNPTAGCGAGEFYFSEPLMVIKATKMSGMGRTAIDGAVTKINCAGDGFIVGDGHYVNGADLDNYYLKGSGLGIGLSLIGSNGKAVNDSSIKRFRIEGFAVGIKSTYAWSNKLEVVRVHNCDKPFQFDSQSNNITLDVFNASGGSQTSTFKNAEGITFNSFNLVNQTADYSMSLFQSYVTINSPYFENVEGSVLIGLSSEVNPSSLVLTGGIIAGDFIIGANGVSLTIDGCRNSVKQSKINSTTGLPVRWAKLNVKSVGLGKDETDLDFRNWHLYTSHEKAILWTNAYGGGNSYSKLYRDYYTFEQAADNNGLTIATDLEVGNQYCFVIAMRKESHDMPVSVRSGGLNLGLSDTAIPNSDSFWVIRHLPFVAIANDLKLLFKGTLQIKLLAISRGVANTGSVQFPTVTQWRGNGAPQQGSWLAGDVVISEDQNRNGSRCAVSGTTGTWIDY